jgi:hypothetical protein
MKLYCGNAQIVQIQKSIFIFTIKIEIEKHEISTLHIQQIYNYYLYPILFNFLIFIKNIPYYRYEIIVILS